MVLVLLVPVAAAAKAIDGRVSAAAPAKATARNPRLEGENEGCSPLWSLQVDVMWPSWLRLLNSRQHSREPGLNAATPAASAEAVRADSSGVGRDTAPAVYFTGWSFNSAYEQAVLHLSLIYTSDAADDLTRVDLG